MIVNRLFCFHQRPDSPVNTNAEYRQQLENQIKKYKDNRRKRYESDMESGVKRLDLCKKELALKFLLNSF